MSRIILPGVAAMALAAVLVASACGGSSPTASKAPASGAPAAGSTWTAPAEAKNLKNPEAGKAESAAAGKTLYASNCAACHGAAGKGDGPAGAALSPKPTNLTVSAANQTEGEIFWKITEGKGPMPAWKSLSEQDRWHLVSYIMSLK